MKKPPERFVDYSFKLGLEVSVGKAGIQEAVQQQFQSKQWPAVEPRNLK